MLNKIGRQSAEARAEKRRRMIESEACVIPTGRTVEEIDRYMRAMWDERLYKEARARGTLAEYANPGLSEPENLAWEKAVLEKFDYTEWQKEFFDSKTPAEISAEASRFEAAQPFASEAVRL